MKAEQFYEGTRVEFQINAISYRATVIGVIGSRIHIIPDTPDCKVSSIDLSEDSELAKSLIKLKSYRAHSVRYVMGLSRDKKPRLS